MFRDASAIEGDGTGLPGFAGFDRRSRRDLPVAAIGDHADLTAWHWSDHATTVHNEAA
jgi:hypothetical protein